MTIQMVLGLERRLKYDQKHGKKHELRQNLRHKEKRTE